MNTSSIIGNIGAAPELRQAGDTPCCRFSVAVNRKWRGPDGSLREGVDWIRVVCFGTLATNCHRYLKKGARVGVTGRLATDTWRDEGGMTRSVTYINARAVDFL